MRLNLKKTLIGTSLSCVSLGIAGQTTPVHEQLQVPECLAKHIPGPINYSQKSNRSKS